MQIVEESKKAIIFAEVSMSDQNASYILPANDYWRWDNTALGVRMITTDASKVEPIDIWGVGFRVKATGYARFTVTGRIDPGSDAVMHMRNGGGNLAGQTSLNDDSFMMTEVARVTGTPTVPKYLQVFQYYNTAIAYNLRMTCEFIED